jgi:hypothetical protein
MGVAQGRVSRVRSRAAQVREAMRDIDSERPFLLE